MKNARMQRETILVWKAIPCESQSSPFQFPPLPSDPWSVKGTGRKAASFSNLVRSLGMQRRIMNFCNSERTKTDTFKRPDDKWLVRLGIFGNFLVMVHHAASSVSLSFLLTCFLDKDWKGLLLIFNPQQLLQINSDPCCIAKWRDTSRKVPWHWRVSSLCGKTCSYKIPKWTMWNHVESQNHVEDILRPSFNQSLQLSPVHGSNGHSSEG